MTVRIGQAEEVRPLKLGSSSVCYRVNVLKALAERGVEVGLDLANCLISRREEPVVLVQHLVRAADLGDLRLHTLTKVVSRRNKRKQTNA